jgi:cardiolipin synthase
MPVSLWPPIVVAAEFLFRIGLIAYILARRRQARPVANLAWITVIMAVPLAGAIGYLLVGETRLGRYRIKRHAAIRARTHEPYPETAASIRATQPSIGASHRPLAVLAESVGGNRPLGGHEIDLIGDDDDFVGALVDDIDRAERFCHLLFYIYLVDHSGRRVADALERAARRGVACRLLVDAVGSRRFLRSNLREELERDGVRVVGALPTNAVRALLARLDLRNHRKLAIIDGVTAYVGSHNIADAAFAPKARYAPWIDASARVRGPVVRDLHELFVEDWYMDTTESLESELAVEPGVVADGATTQVMGTGPNAYNEALRQLSVTALHAAREEIVLTTPYFVPDEAMATALCTAARRGVETTLVLPRRNDSPLVGAASRSHYQSLLNAGVRLYEFEAGLLHAKTLTFDRALALITTANLDRRSFELNFEVSMVVYDTDIASRLRFLQTSYLTRSRRVEQRDWRRRAWTTRVRDNAAGTLSPLL